MVKGEFGKRKGEVMKCLTIKQPWASWILNNSQVPIAAPLPKDIENRTWSTKYRGPLLIHAGKARDRARKFLQVPGLGDTDVLGAILGVVDLVDVVEGHGSVWAIGGHYHWVLANPRAFGEPIPYKGRLGLYEVSDPRVDAAIRLANGEA
jgi:hypothetical protein